ncbi:MAG TPA: outer membrane lipoprotein carrier protein LolA [Trinickia sp.]|uniref:outer membrane lipoprotein carrier protein LolA n=1 Tax=Trinickia sp. TaxID=2571163 RepID=UPI002F411E30
MRRTSDFNALRANARAAWAVAILAAATCCLSAAPLATAAATPAATAAPAAAGTAQWTLDRLMSTLAHNKSGRASFTETKYLAIADKPIESTGELAFVAPDHLEKVTVSPKPERLVVDGDKLTVDRNQRKYTVSLAHYPELAAFIESIRATLAGNRYVLEQLYKVSIGGRGDDWTLTLTPLDSRMLKTVQTIKLDGTRDVLRTVVIEQADGDHSVMQLRNASRQ